MFDYKNIPDGPEDDEMEQYLKRFLGEKEDIVKTKGVMYALEQLEYIAEKETMTEYCRTDIEEISNFVIHHLDYKDVTIDNPAFGKMRNFGNWYTVDCFDFTLWGKKYSIRMSAVAWDENEPVTSEQEDACREFLRNIETYQKYVEDIVMNLFHITDEEILRDVTQAEEVLFSRDGRYGLAMSTSLDNDYLEECGIGPDENFGIALSPDRFVITSNDEFLGFYG